MEENESAASWALLALTDPDRFEALCVLRYIMTHNLDTQEEYDIREE